MQLTLLDYLAAIQTGDLTPAMVLSHYQNKAKTQNSTLNAIVSFNDEYVAQHQADFASRALAGAPFLIKDNILLADQKISAGSKILQGYRASYSATVMEELEKAGALAIGITNMDEFGAGGITESSIFGASKNPHSLQHSPGGSSGGSAAAVAADLALFALGTDTGGSVRQPAAHCGIVGFKPSYGAISRYGVIAMASSFDQVGILSKTVADVQLIFSHLAKSDTRDAQSYPQAAALGTLDPSPKKEKSDLQKLKILVPQEIVDLEMDEHLRKRFLERVDQLSAAGYQLVFAPAGYFPGLIRSYQILMSAELSSNVARFDGIRYGLQKNTQDFVSLDEYYSAIRAEGFGLELKKRILLGSYVLAAEQYEEYYLSATQARQALIAQLDQLFQSYDLILTPTSLAPAPLLKTAVGAEPSLDPIAELLQDQADLFTVPANLAGLPAISLPMGTVVAGEVDLPVGLQLMAPKYQDQQLLAFAAEIAPLVAL